MAAEISTAVLSALSQIMQPYLQRQWNRTTYFLGLLNAAPASISAGFGKNVAFDVEFTGATAQTVAEGADVPAAEFNSDVDTVAIFPWATYRSSFQISEQEIDMARTSVGIPQALQDLIGDRILGCGAQLARQIETDSLQGTGVDANGNPTLVGIYGGALSASGVYGGINPATYSEWASNVVSNGGVARTLTPDLMAQLDQNIFTAAAVPWNLVMTSAGVTRRYESFFNTAAAGNANFPLIRMNDTASAPQFGTGIPNDGQMQLQTLWYKGSPVIRNPVNPTGQLALLNTNYIAVKYLPHVPTRNELEYFQSLGLQGSSAGGTPSGPGTAMQPVQATGLPVRLVEIAKTGDSHKISMRITLAMCVTRRNACGVLKDVSEVT
jgi:hypothetical protein